MGRDIVSYVRTEGPNSTLVDVDNKNIQSAFDKIPVIYYTEQAQHKLRLLKTEGDAYTLAELQAYTGWDFAIAEDFNGTTVPPVRTQSGITVTEETWNKTDGTEVTGGVIIIPLDANTTELQTILGTEPYIYNQADSPQGRKITVGTELLGYIAPEVEPSLIVQYPFVFRNRRITSETPPGTVGVDYLTPAQIAALYVEEAPNDGNIYARQNASWVIAAGSGDMVKSIYDPTNVNGDAFNMDNMLEGTNAKILQLAERTKLSGIGDGAQVVSCNSGTDITVDNTDPQNPIFNFTGSTSPSLTVKDGTTTVNNVDLINFSGAVVSDDGNGDVTVTITGGGGGEANTASNVGTAGQGVFNAKNGVNLEFRKINSLTNAITINLDAPNNKLDLDIVESQINHLNLSNVGTNTHAQIDSHISDDTIHFTQSQINTDNITEGSSQLLMTTSERSKVSNIRTDQGTSTFLNGAGNYTVAGGYSAPATTNAVADTDALVADTVTNTYAAGTNGTVTVADTPTNGTKYWLYVSGAGTVSVDLAGGGSAITETITTSNEVVCIEYNTVSASYRLVRGIEVDISQVTTTGDAVDTTYSSDGSGGIKKTKNNLIATTSPTTTDDSAAGYAVGSKWIDVTNDKVYECVDSTASAAVWIELSATGGGASTWDGKSGKTTDYTLVAGDDGDLVWLTTSAAADRTFTLKSSPVDKDTVWIANRSATYRLTVSDGTDDVQYLFEREMFKFVYSDTLAKWLVSNP